MRKEQIQSAEIEMQIEIDVQMEIESSIRSINRTNTRVFN
jgi:hypothetical protein